MQFINPIGRNTTVNCKYITLDFYTIPPDFPPQFHHHTQFMFADNLVVKYAAVLPMVLNCQTLPKVDYGSRTLPSLVIPLPDIAIEDPVGVVFGGGAKFPVYVLIQYSLVGTKYKELCVVNVQYNAYTL